MVKGAIWDKSIFFLQISQHFMLPDNYREDFNTTKAFVIERYSQWTTKYRKEREMFYIKEQQKWNQ